MDENTTLSEAMLAWLVVPILWALQGYVLLLYWFWFAVPFGAPPVRLAQAMGLGLLGITFTRGFSTEKKREHFKGWEAHGVLFLQCVLSLGVGWLVHWAIGWGW